MFSEGVLFLWSFPFSHTILRDGGEGGLEAHFGFLSLDFSNEAEGKNIFFLLHFFFFFLQFV